jgi:hypothetical protein
VLAGLLLRRSIAAMVAAFIRWLAIRLVIEYLLRPHFITPPTAQGNCGPPHGCSVGISSVPQPTGRIGDWVLGMNATASATSWPAGLAVPVHRGRNLRGPHRRRARRHDLVAAPARFLGHLAASLNTGR